MHIAAFVTALAVLIGSPTPISADDRPSDPFGNHTIELNKETPLVEIWEFLRDQLLLDKQHATYQDGVQISHGNRASVTMPILATRKNGKQFAIALFGPLTPGHPADASLLGLKKATGVELIVINELLVRGNLPAATREVQQRIDL